MEIKKCFLKSLNNIRNLNQVESQATVGNFSGVHVGVPVKSQTVTFTIMSEFLSPSNDTTDLGRGNSRFIGKVNQVEGFIADVLTTCLLSFG